MKKRIFILLILLFPALNLFAQVPPPPDQGMDASGTPGAPSTPIDQNIIFLIVAALLLAGCCIWNQRKMGQKIV